MAVDFVMSELLPFAIKVGIVLFLVINITPLMVFVERKLGAFVQDRVGPEIVGLAGVLQPLADALKFFVKESFVPRRVDKFLYYIAPLFAFVPPLFAFAVVPFATVLEPLRTTMGILFVLAFASLSVWGLILSGWSSDNKFSLFGALRASSQFISYELALSTSLLAMLIYYGTFDFVRIVEFQEGSILNWGIFKNPVAFLVSFVAAFAESARIPFDLPEAEAEIVAGYHTEYSGMKFALFFMGEYAHMALASAIITLVYLGGWNIPFLKLDFGDLLFAPVFQGVIEFAVFSVKFFTIIGIFALARWTLPRFRFDQVTSLGWGTLLPLALLSILISAYHIFSL